jgi:spermidine synthase
MNGQMKANSPARRIEEDDKLRHVPAYFADNRTLAMPVLFSLTIFLSAALLFGVELVIGKMILPKFGGGPAVWNTCMLFFQAALLLGYGYAHWLAGSLGRRTQVLVHLGVMLLPFLALPLAIPASWSPPSSVHPIVCLLGYLAVAAGLPFFAVCTTAPLLQGWFSQTDHRRAADPYFLYAASNVGSFVGLLAYPTLIEPALGLSLQGWLWAAGYALLAPLLAACAAVFWRSSRLPAAKAKTTLLGPVTPPTWRQRLHWVVLAFVPSSLMLGVTTYFSSEISPVPMMWVIPLSLYLLSFVLAFSHMPAAAYRALAGAMPLLVLLVVFTMLSEWVPLRYVGTLTGLLPLHVITFFVAATTLHGRLASERPPATFLTEYYLWVSAGGVLGGLFNGLLAPLVFPAAWEYPLALAFALALAPPWTAFWRSLPVAFQGALPGDRGARLLSFGVPVVVAALTGAIALLVRQTGDAAHLVQEMVGRSGQAVPVVACLLALPRPPVLSLCVAIVIALNLCLPPPGGRRLHQERTFFGIIAVMRDEKTGYNHFYHGRTDHGAQCMNSEEARRVPRTYFYPTGPIGELFTSFGGAHAKKRVAVVGLGAGTLAAYGKPGQEFTFFEIDPAVERVAEQYFTYLEDCRADHHVVLGDARLTMAREPSSSYDVIFLDAFTSDALPVHLITEEAMQMYLEKLAPGGLLVVDASNNYVDLESVVAAVAHDCRLHGLIALDDHISAKDEAEGKYPSYWIVLARAPTDFGALARSERWRPIQTKKLIRGWTDDYSNVLSVLEWRP